MRVTNKHLKIAFAAIVLLATALLAFLFTRGEAEYDSSGAARRPLVVINGQQQQLPLADYLSSPGGMSTNATGAGSGDVQTDTGTASGIWQSGGLKNTAQTVRTGRVAVGISASQNNYNPTGLATASMLDITPDSNLITITGLMAQPTGTEILVRNASDTWTLRFPNNSGASSAGNKFDFLFTMDLDPYQEMTLRYNGSAWTIAGSGCAGFCALVNMTVRATLNVGQIRPGYVTLTDAGTSDDINEGDVVVLQYNGVGDATWTGFLGGAVGRPLIIQNLTGYKLTLANETGSFSGRQIRNTGGVDIELVGGPTSSLTAGISGAIYVYDGQMWNLNSFTSPTSAVPQLYTSAKTKGTIILTAGTGTATVLAGAKCVCTDISTTPTPVGCDVTSTTLTAKGTGTDSVTYLCF